MITITAQDADAQKWEMVGPGRGDKSFFILSENISLEVDYDDVDRKTVLKEAKRVLEILNEADSK